MEKKYSYNQIKDKILDTFEFSISYFNKHSIDYFSAFGTVLGAVRHKGIIPWDDDVDIYMKRCDFEKLMCLNDDLEKHGYRIEYLHRKGYYLPIAKICNTNTKMIEDKEFPYAFGIYIDIFILEGPNDYSTLLEFKIQHERCSDNYLRGLRMINFSDYGINRLFEFIKRVAVKLLNYRSVEENRSFLLNTHVKPIPNGEYVVALGGVTGHGIMKREWFDSYVNLPFESFTIRVPAQYEEYLTFMYGDYMQLPPEEKRRSHHNRYYINLDEGY